MLPKWLRWWLLRFTDREVWEADKLTTAELIAKFEAGTPAVVARHRAIRVPRDVSSIHIEDCYIR